MKKKLGHQNTRKPIKSSKDFSYILILQENSNYTTQTPDLIVLERKNKKKCWGGAKTKSQK